MIREQVGFEFKEGAKLFLFPLSPVSASLDVAVYFLVLFWEGGTSGDG